MGCSKWLAIAWPLAVVFFLMLLYPVNARSGEGNMYYGFFVGCGDISANSGVEGLQGCEVDLHHGEVFFLHEGNATSDVLRHMEEAEHELGTPIVLYYTNNKTLRSGSDNMTIVDVTFHESPPWL